jgi:nucleoside-diphosphate-sugar epimerase
LRQEAGNISWVIVRPPVVYGPGDAATVPLMRSLARPIVFLPGSAATRLSLIHVEDLARALAMLASNRDIESRVLEIDDGKAGGYNFEEIAAAASQATGVNTRVVFVPRPLLAGPALLSLLMARATRVPAMFCPDKLGELYHGDWVVSSDKQEFAGWQPQIDFSTGFADTLKWYKEHGWLPEGIGNSGRSRQEGAVCP